MHKTLVVSLLALISACVGSDDLMLDLAPEDHARYDELRSRLAITVRFDPTSFVGINTGCDEIRDRSQACCGPNYCSARGLAVLLENGCIDDREVVDEAPDRQSMSACAQRVLAADANMCVAQRLLRIIEDPEEATLRARNSDVENVTTNEIVVGPQDAESNTELAREAIRRLMLVQAEAATALNSCSAANLTTAAFLPATMRTDAEAALTLAEELAHFYASPPSSRTRHGCSCKSSPLPSPTRSSRRPRTAQKRLPCAMRRSRVACMRRTSSSVAPTSSRRSGARQTEKDSSPARR